MNEWMQFLSDKRSMTEKNVYWDKNVYSHMHVSFITKTDDMFGSEKDGFPSYSVCTNTLTNEMTMSHEAHGTIKVL